MHTPLQFIFVGRLVEEKGFDLVLAMCEKIHKEGQLDKNIHIHIFGAGSFQDDLPTYDFVTYYGHQPKADILKVRETCHYTLMPSKFLETFGLTALDSLSVGVPIIAPDKGGLSQFLIGETTTLQDTRLYETITTLVTNFHQDERDLLSQQCKERHLTYTKSARLKKFTALSGLAPGATILLISDYVVDVGGIEHYLLNAQQLLQEAGYQVHVVGCEDKEQAQHRFWGLFTTIRHTKAQHTVEEAVAKYTPDLLWRHSTQRRLGPAPLWSQKKFSGKQWVMYHDFGLFHPYPSQVNKEKQISSITSFGLYMRAGRKATKLQRPLCLPKWYSSTILKALFAKHMDLHLVPSPFMELLVQGQYHEDIPLTTLAHFV